MNEIISLCEIERKFEYKKWCDEMPYLKFKSSWEVSVIPPFGGAIARFRIKENNAIVSVYLDCYDNLGFFGEPYWEVYPYEEDVYRCKFNNTDELIEAIDKSIKQQNRKIK